MALLERDTHLAELAAVLRDATTGQGSVVLVTGEAGAGKTALVREFAAAHEHARVLWGLCDELITPRPLGPFRDMFPWLAADATRDGVGTDLLGALIDELGRASHATVVVVEDAQWADRATLDAIRFIGRRISRLAAVLVVTYRLDEVPSGHALRVALGAVPGAAVRRIRLPSLSIDAVARLAGRREVDELYTLTGGNPFYLHEVLAAPGVQVPLTVQDAVMTRAGRLSRAGRAAVEVASTVPGPAEPWLLDECGATAEGVEEAVRAGVLRRVEETVTFPHELTRRAVRQSLTPTHRRRINGRVLDALVARDADPARLTHHAVEADRVDAVVTYAPAAARRAAALASSAEAFDHYGQALEYAEHFTEPELLDLLEGYAEAAGPAGRWDEACTATERAIELCRQAGDRIRQGRNLCRLSDVEWSVGRGHRAHRAVDEAIRLLEQEPAGEILVAAYSQRAKLAMVDHRHDDAVRWGERAIAVAGDAGLGPPIHALVTVGSSRLQAEGHEAGLVDALDRATQIGDLHAVARAYVNLADLLTLHLRYDEAWRYIDEGMQLFEAHDLIGAIDHMLGARARWHLERGQWDEVDSDDQISPGLEGTGVTLIETALGVVRARRGDLRAATTLAVAEQHARRCGDTQLLVPVAFAHAELAWLSGDPAASAEAVAAVAGRVRESALPRWLGETALWNHRAGVSDDVPDGAAEPYARQVRGDWAGAARCWAELGRPYEQADALAGAPDPEPVLEALATFDRLGAAARAAMVRERLTVLGVTSVPRGPRSETLANPGQLTARQVEVLELLGAELTYQQIATRLQLSIKTVDHHVAAIRTKLGVASRNDAVAAGRRLGILV
jgi:DNA-binding CsgD family transcriptional regulator/tetratricopeptide (TPR) repeat protein